MTPHANLESPQFFSQVPYGRPSPIPLAGSEQRQEQAWTPALLAFPWHCHRACPAHCQLPALGQRMQQPLPTWVWQQPAAGYSEAQCISVEERPSKKSITMTEPTKGSVLQSHLPTTSFEQLWLRTLVLHSLAANIRSSCFINQSVTASHHILLLILRTSSCPPLALL